MADEKKIENSITQDAVAEGSENVDNIDVDKARQVILSEIGTNLKKAAKNIKDKPLLPRMPIIKKKSKKSNLNKKSIVKMIKVDSKMQFKIIISSLIIFILISISITLAGIYLGRWQSPVITQISRYIPLPAFYINGESVGIHDFLSDSEILTEYFARQNLDYNKESIRNQIYEKIIELKVIEQLANEKELNLTQEEIDEELIEILGVTNLNEEVGDITEELYGWNYKTYIKKVVRPILLAQKLEENFYISHGVNQIRSQMRGFYDVVIEDESQFEEIASEINQDSSKLISGDLGWIKLGETVPEFEIVLLKLREGEISEVIETRYGFHIIRLNEKMVEENEPLYQASHIFIKRPSFIEYLEDQIQQATIVTLLRI